MSKSYGGPGMLAWDEPLYIYTRALARLQAQQMAARRAGRPAKVAKLQRDIWLLRVLFNVAVRSAEAGSSSAEHIRVADAPIQLWAPTKRRGSLSASRRVTNAHGINSCHGSIRHVSLQPMRHPLVTKRDCRRVKAGGRRKSLS
jgi:hypothetical protein